MTVSYTFVPRRGPGVDVTRVVDFFVIIFVLVGPLMLPSQVLRRSMSFICFVEEGYARVPFEAGVVLPVS